MNIFQLPQEGWPRAIVKVAIEEGLLETVRGDCNLLEDIESS